MGINGGLANLDGSRKVGLPDIVTGNKAKKEDKGNGFDSSDDGLKLGRSAVNVNVETNGREFGGRVELALKLETDVENEDGFVDLDPFGAGSLELGQRPFV